MLSMDILVALGLLKRLLDDVPRIKRLAPNPKNKEFPAWDDEVKRIIEGAFGRDSKEYTRYDGIVLLKRARTQEDKERAYIDHISQREHALRDIISDYDVPTMKGTHDDGRGNVKAELEYFHDGLTRYIDLVKTRQRGTLANEQENELQTLRTQLQRDYGSLKEIIEKYGGPSIVLLQGGNYRCEAFSSVFNHTLFSPTAFVVVADAAITTLNMAIGKLEKLQRSERLPPEAVFPNGRQYDAYEAIKDRISTATERLTVADSWGDSDLFTLLGNVQSGVQIQVLTTNMIGDFRLAGEKFKKQHEQAKDGTLSVRSTRRLHDRFLIVDDRIFHLGASIKDAGSKLCVMTEIQDVDIKKTVNETISRYYDEGLTVL